MNPQDAFNLLLNAARQLKLTAAEHESITQAALTLKPIIEKHITEQSTPVVKKPEKE